MPSSLPSHFPDKFKRIHLELTNRCNFSCVFCPDGRMTRKRGFMDKGLAFSALDQIAELDIAEKVTFHVMGEPLLHPNFFEILDHASAIGLKVGLTTNGALLRPDTIRELAGRAIHQIDISLQTPDAESFAATRGARLDFQQYTGRLLDLLEACSKRPDPPVFKIRIMTTRFAGSLLGRLGIPNFMGDSAILRRTVEQWTDMVAHRLGRSPADRSGLARKIRGLSIYGWNVIEISPKIFIETYILTDWGNAFSSEKIIDAHRGYCFGMQDHFAILYSGDVVLCCIDYDGKTSVGNLNTARLSEILGSHELETIVKALVQGRLVHPHCRQCLGSSSKIGSLLKPSLAWLGLKVFKPVLYRTSRLYD